MSETPQHGPGTSEGNVSRETNPSEETPELTPEQKILNDIMDRAMVKNQERQTGEDPEDPIPPQEEPEEKQQDPPLPPQKSKPSSFYVYLAVLFGAAFLMLLLAYFVQQRNNAAVRDDLRLATASREELLESIKALEEERDQFQKEVEYQKDLVTQKNEEAEQLQSSLEASNSRWSDQKIQTMTLKYFWYIDQFMENKEYFMAASAVVFGAEYYRTTWNSQVSINPAQAEQYEAYRQELIDRGYLEERPNISTMDHISPTKLCFTQKWDPSQHEDMAALCILCCALEQHFVKNNDHAAAQYLSLNPLGDPASGYQERIERLASDFTLEQFQLMKDALVESKWLTIAEDGAMSVGFGPTGFREDILYNLPFELPLETLAKIPLN